MRRKLLISLLMVLSFWMRVNPHVVGLQDEMWPVAKKPLFLSSDSAWVDSVMGSLSLEEKIAQLLMLQVYSNKDGKYEQEQLKLVQKLKPGGVIFFHGSPDKQAILNNKLQKVSKVPLLMAIDGEWGLSMRLQNVIQYPRQMQLGAIQNNAYIYEMGLDIAEQMKRAGIHMNFAPVADINNNQDNPVINTRSFGEDRNLVSGKVNAYMKGMQDGGLLVTAKHFPGHGDTDVDSHHGLPLIPFDKDRLDSLELYPFRMAMAEELSGVMVAHMQIPALDSSGSVSTVSEPIVSGLLQEEMGFEGLIVTDALGMRGVADYYDPGKLELAALKAGVDILLMSKEPAKAISTIKRAVKRGEVSEARIDHSCRKILLAKNWLGLAEEDRKYVESEGIVADLNKRDYLALEHSLSEKAITLLKDETGAVPFGELELLRMATINIGVDTSTEFTNTTDLYHSADHYFYADPSEFPADTTLEKLLAKYSNVIVSVYYTRSFGNNFDIPEGVKEFVNGISVEGELIFNLFSYPYALGVLGELANMDAVLLSYSNRDLSQSYAAQALFGGIAIEGMLPVSIGDKYPFGAGLKREKVRLKYSVPESVGLNYDTLKLVEAIIAEAIQEKATPGCQLLVARRGEVIWNESYGAHSYRNERRVKNSDLYDIASITKISSTIPALMRLEDQGRIHSDSSLGSFVRDWRIDTSNKSDLVLKDVLTHQSGLAAWIPFYKSTLEPLDTAQSLFSTNFSYTYPIKMGPSSYANRNIKYVDSAYRKSFSNDYPVQVAEDMYLQGEYRDSIYASILGSKLGEKKYRYSDLGYYMIYKGIESLTDTAFYPYNWYNFYGPLGAETMGFMPLNRFEPEQIVPTENDVIFRKQMLRGYVHDPGAAMLGGVCGHAGLFSNANDLAKLLQMYLNNGVYGGERFIDSATIAKYTARQFMDGDNRRGLGFDRPMDEEDAGPVCDSASMRSYGHTGFTGTIAWVDPEYDLVYVFLSNRIHPNQYNLKLISMDVRTRVQEVVYRAVGQ